MRAAREERNALDELRSAPTPANVDLEEHVSAILMYLVLLPLSILIYIALCNPANTLPVCPFLCILIRWQPPP